MRLDKSYLDKEITKEWRIRDEKNRLSKVSG